MLRSIRRPSPALVVACLALAVALSGTSYADVLNVPRNSVGTANLKNNAVVSSKVKNRSLLAADFKAGQLPAGPPGPAGAKGDKGDKGDVGAPGVSEYDIVRGTSISSSTTGRSVLVSCPAGKKVLGGGATVSPLGGGGQLGPVLQHSAPPDDAKWTAYAVEHEPFALNWTLSAYAICAKVS